MPNCSTEFEERHGLNSPAALRYAWKTTPTNLICNKFDDLQFDVSSAVHTLNMPNCSTEFEERLGLSSPAALRYAWRTTPTYSVTWILAQSNSFAVLCF